LLRFFALYTKTRLTHRNEVLPGAVLGKSILFYVGISTELHDTRKAEATLLETNGWTKVKKKSAVVFCLVGFFAPLKLISDLNLSTF
jgi:hypothetical protein